MSILIAGIGRNIENSIPFLKITFENVASEIDHCAVAIFENNSTDHTPEVLRQWSSRDCRVYAICETISLEKQLARGKAHTWDNQPCRIEILAAARNELLDIIMGPEYDSYELVLMMDLDILQPLPRDETLQAIRSFPSDAAAVFSYGVNSAGKMYDLYAYRDEALPFGPEILGEEFFSIPHQKRFFRHTKRLKHYEYHPVYSAFNGAALYRRSLLKGYRYSAHPSRDLDMLYREQARRMGKEPADWFPRKTGTDGDSQGVYLFGADGFFYRDNAGYNFPIVNEHAILHASLIQKGKLLLRPQWIHQTNHLGYYF